MDKLDVQKIGMGSHAMLIHHFWSIKRLSLILRNIKIQFIHKKWKMRIWTWTLSEKKIIKKVSKKITWIIT